MRRLAILAALSLVATLPVRGQTPPSAEALTEQVQKHYDGVQDFRSEFTHTYRDAIVKVKQTGRGEVRIKKPGRMWWKYVTPERKDLVSDGSTIYVYQAVDNSVAVSPMPKPSEQSTPLLFLAGRGNLTRDFRATLLPSQPPSEWHIRLVPRTPQAEFNELVLMVDRSTLKLAGLLTITKQGEDEYRFPNLRENVKLSDSEFDFKIPKGAVIIK